MEAVGHRGVEDKVTAEVSAKRFGKTPKAIAWMLPMLWESCLREAANLFSSPA
jgi:hypothetical protein